MPRWLIAGLLYSLLEIISRGHTNWAMVPLVMTLCIPLDIANEYMPWHLLQGFLGGLIIMVVVTVDCGWVSWIILNFRLTSGAAGI